MAEETIMLQLQDDVQATAYHELRVERMRQALVSSSFSKKKPQIRTF